VSGIDRGSGLNRLSEVWNFTLTRKRTKRFSLVNMVDVDDVTNVRQIERSDSLTFRVHLSASQSSVQRSADRRIRVNMFDVYDVTNIRQIERFSYSSCTSFVFVLSSMTSPMSNTYRVIARRNILSPEKCKLMTFERDNSQTGSR